MPTNSVDPIEVALGQILREINLVARLSFGNPTSTTSDGATASAAATAAGGLSAGGGVRVGGAGGPSGGVSYAGTGTLNDQGYQGSAGLSVGGLSANVGVKVGSGGLSLSGSLQPAIVGQGLVGSLVGPKIVGPKIVGPKIVGDGGGVTSAQTSVAPERQVFSGTRLN